ncbi:MAG: glycosyltransferase [Ignavibacteria bacterium]
MKNKNFCTPDNSVIQFKEILNFTNSFVQVSDTVNKAPFTIVEKDKSLPEILFITSYPPRECGIANYSHDLINAIDEKFSRSYSLKVCALESNGIKRKYPAEVKYVLQTSEFEQYAELAEKINSDNNLALVFIQHEFGLFGGKYGVYINRLLCLINKPVITTFHTILPDPDMNRKKVVQDIADHSGIIIVMTTNSATILKRDYDIPAAKIAVISHGTHKIPSFDQNEKKVKNHLGNQLVLSTFGLLCSTKSIETALDALPAIIEKFPNVIYLIIGKTHPDVIKHEGEKYRDFLYDKVIQLELQDNVRFINKYLSLEDLLDYLQSTDIYLFTSKDPNQAVSGTFAYAMSCGCPIISTPIPHAKEFIDSAGIIFDFQSSQKLTEAAIRLLSDSDLMKKMRSNALQIMGSTTWQNSAIAHMKICTNIIKEKYNPIRYSTPEIPFPYSKCISMHNEGIEGNPTILIEPKSTVATIQLSSVTHSMN